MFPLSLSAGGGGPSGAYGGMASGFSTGAFVVNASPTAQALAVTSSAGSAGARNNALMLFAIVGVVYLALRRA